VKLKYVITHKIVKYQNGRGSGEERGPKMAGQVKLAMMGGSVQLVGGKANAGDAILFHWITKG